jgi:germination protein YpeB
MKSEKIIITSVVSGLALSLVFSVVFGIFLAIDAGKKRDEIQNNYQRSFYTLCSASEDLETDLSKLAVSSCDKECLPILADAYSHSRSAIEGFAGLPMGEKNSDCYRFFNQVSDWSESYVRAVSRGEGAAFKAQAHGLYLTARTLNDNLKRIAQKSDGKTLYFGNKILPEGYEAIDLSFDGASVEFPTLIYDGPFSDEEEFNAAYLEGKSEVSEQDAKRVCEQTLGMSAVRSLGLIQGKVPTFAFSGESDGGDAYAMITQKGGYVYAYSSHSERAGKDKIAEDEAKKIATAFVRKLGYTRMEPVWYNSMDGEAYVNLAPIVDGVTYYTDLIKVKVSLYSGTVTAVECTGYVASYTKRSYVAAIDKSEAIRKADSIEIISVSEAVIPYGKGEKYCYEIYGSKYGLDYYIYVDAISGDQVEILRVIDTEQGKKTA